MKVKNMTGRTGRVVANQFVITKTDSQRRITTEWFQSYDSVIAMRITAHYRDSIVIKLDKTYWDYSKTTGKYRNLFLGETKKRTQVKIDSGEYLLVNLNQ